MSSENTLKFKDPLFIFQDCNDSNEVEKRINQRKKVSERNKLDNYKRVNSTCKFTQCKRTWGKTKQKDILSTQIKNFGVNNVDQSFRLPWPSYGTLMDMLELQKEKCAISGKNFVFEKMTFTLTKKIPKEFEQFDFYSNVWHQDSDSYKILKIFILIDDVGPQDGPLTYLTHKETALYWHVLRDRFVNSTLKIQDEKQFTGTKGDYFIIDTSKNLHRGSNPVKDRKLLTLTLYPEWSITSDFERMKWNSKF